MNRFAFSLAIAAATLSCSGSDPEDSQPSECDPNMRSGTYLMSFAALDGNCGPIPSQLTRLAPNAALPENCFFDAYDTISDRGCTLERSYTCFTDTAEVSIVAITTQETADGSRITGLATVRIQELIASCAGTYSILAVRQ